MYSYPIWLWWSPHNLPQIYILLSNLTMSVPPTISLRYMYSYPIWLCWSPHNLPQVYVLLSNLTMRVPDNLPQVYVLLSNLTMRVPPQSPSSICTLIQSDYEGPPTISLRYIYSYPIWLWGSPPTISLRWEAVLDPSVSYFACDEISDLCHQ
jgi:hypothetical protein